MLLLLASLVLLLADAEFVFRGMLDIPLGLMSLLRMILRVLRTCLLSRLQRLCSRDNKLAEGVPMYSFSEEAIIAGDISAIWAVATDVTAWPSWDPHEEKARIDGEFAPGTTGWNKPAGAPAGMSTITEVESGRMWASRAGIPFGYLRGENRYEPVGVGRVRVSKRFEVHGPFAPVFRLIWEKKVRADMHKTFTALEAEAGCRG